MKINNLTESTLASMPNQAGAQAPTFGRDPNMLETTAGAISSVATPIAGMQRRSKGSMLKGIKSSKKFPNSVEEGAMPPSVIKAKEKIRLMSDADKKEYFKGKSKEQLQNMARSHGYGQGSNVYAKYVTEGVLDDTRARMAASRNPAVVKPTAQPTAPAADQAPKFKVGDKVSFAIGRGIPNTGTITAMGPGPTQLTVKTDDGNENKLDTRMKSLYLQLETTKPTAQPQAASFVMPASMGSKEDYAARDAWIANIKKQYPTAQIMTARSQPKAAAQVDGKIIARFPETSEVTEAKGLHKKVKIVKGPDAGKIGWIRQIKLGLFKGAPKKYDVDIDGGGQANGLPATALRLIKDEQGVTEEAPASLDKPIHEIEYSVKGPQSAVKRKIKVKASSHDSAINALKSKLGNGVVIHTISTEQNMTEGKPANLNDDDWYEINPSTNTIIRQTGPSSYRLPFGSREIKLPNGNVVMRGMRAKYIDGLKSEMSEAAGDEWEEETGKFQRFVEYAKKALMRERDPKRRIESANYLSKQENKFFGSPIRSAEEETPFGSVSTGKAFTDLIKGIMSDIQSGNLHYEQQALSAAIWLEPEGKQFLKTAHDDFIKMMDHSRKEREQHAIALSGYQIANLGGRVVGSLKGGIVNDPTAAMTPEILGVYELAEQEILRKKGEREDEEDRQRNIAMWNALPMPLKIAAAAATGRTPAQLEKIIFAKSEIEAVGGLDASDFPNLPQQASAADDEFVEPEKAKK